MRVGGQWVGAVWTLFEPLAHTLSLLALLSVALGRQAPAGEFPVFLVTGLLPFFLFQHLSSRLMDGIESNRGLFAYRQVKPIDVLIARTVVEIGMNLTVMIFTLSLLGWLGFEVLPSDPLAFIGAYALVALLGAGFGTLVAVLTHERPRMRSLVRMAMFPLYLISGVIFRIDLVPPEYLTLLLWNPILHLLELVRHAFIPAYQLTDGVGWLHPALTGLAILSFALLLYLSKRQELVRT